MNARPVRLTIEDDLRRNRLTVFFRILLAIPHFIWVFLWSIAVFFVAIVTWVATLATGAPPAALHGFLARYIRYTLHLNAYLYLVTNPYPPFVGDPGAYVVDVALPGPAQQVRWKTLVRIVLAVPALLLSATLAGAGVSVPAPRRGRTFSTGGGGALAFFCAFLGWFASLVTGRMPKGLRDAGAYAVGYNAQVLAYLLFVTDRYPSADPTALLEGLPRPEGHPVHLVGDADDLRRSRLTVFFRLPLVIPHLVWLALWTVLAVLLGIVNYFATLITGAPPRVFHRFFTAFVRYQLHVYAFGYLAANPFPGFTGAPGVYPLDLMLPGEPQRQNRWKTAFRIFLAVPAWIVNAGLGWALILAAVYTWFVALFTGAAPWGLRNLSAYALRYGAQLNAYLYLVTDRYPHASPLEGEDVPEPEPFEPELTAA
ncbi:MAG TPA: DUF4389 domain-containing protein [Gaiellaceae bacterium]